MVGRRINANTVQLRAGTATHSYQCTAVVRGNSMSMKYVATRLDRPGAYEGVSNFIQFAFLELLERLERPRSGSQAQMGDGRPRATE